MSAPVISVDTLTTALDALYTDFDPVIRKVNLNAPIKAPGDWTPRQVLSHIIGSLQRTPVQAGYFLAGAPVVPVVFSDPYWIGAWETAPAESFAAVLRSEVEGNKAFVRSLTEADFMRISAPEGFGHLPLGVFLNISYDGHIRGMHLPQLRAYL